MPEDCCPNCEAVLHGLYCSDCGQRKPRPEDYSVPRFLADTATEIFSVDGKAVRTLRRLFRHPGQLTLDYYEGRRARYLKPIQIFLIVNVLFVLFAAENGLYDFTLDEYQSVGPPLRRSPGSSFPGRSRRRRSASKTTPPLSIAMRMCSGRD